jgi:hypothetical protein
MTAAESAVLGIVSATDPDYGLVALSGGVSTKIHYGPIGPPAWPTAQAVVDCGNDIVVQSLGYLWHWSDNQRRWRLTINPYTTAQTPVEDPTGHASFLMTLGEDAGNTYVYRTVKEPLQPLSTGGVFDSATATLAEYQGKEPFKVNEILVEIDFGNPNVQSGQRSLAVCAITNGIVDLETRYPLATDGTALALQSSTFTKTWDTARSTRNGHREMVRFPVNDGAAATYTAAPRLTLKGIKVRRVIMRCEEV